MCLIRKGNFINIHIHSLRHWDITYLFLILKILTVPTILIFLQEVIDAINDDNIPLAQKKALDITEALVGNDTSSEKNMVRG